MLREELENDPLGIGYAEMSNDEVEFSLNAQTRTKLVPTEIGNGMVLSAVGLTVGNALLDVIYNAPDFRYVKPLLEQGRLDISSPLARGALDSLVGVAEGFEQAHADAIKNLAVRSCSRAEELGISVRASEVREARA